MLKDWRRHTLDILAVIALLAATLVIRGSIAWERRIMPAGDAFNFHQITGYLLHGRYPKTEKRLPVYSLLLIPGRVIHAPLIPTSVTISLLASGGVVVCLYLLGRHFSIERFILLPILGLSIFDPLLTINGIRPLADSTFLFFTVLTLLLASRAVAARPPTLRQLLLLGLSTPLMMFTRYEGFVVAITIFPVLLWKLGWRNALRAATIPLVASLAWIPAYIYIHGSLTGLSYVTDAAAPGGGFGDVHEILPNLDRMVNTMWKRAWAAPAFELSEPKPEAALVRTAVMPAWWLSLLALIGIPWLAIRRPSSGLMVLVALSGYSLLLAWWWVYSRYVAPLSAIYYLTAAAGASALFAFGSRLRWPLVKWASIALVVWIFIASSPDMHKHALGTAWENNYRGYALYRATLLVAQEKGKAVVANSFPMALTLLGAWVENPEPTNPARAWYLEQFPDSPAEDLYQKLTAVQPAHLLESRDDPRLSELATLLKNAGHVTSTEVFTYAPWYTSGPPETVRVHRLQW